MRIDPPGGHHSTESFFNADKHRTGINLRSYALIDDVFTDLIRDAKGRATVRLMYNGPFFDSTSPLSLERIGLDFVCSIIWPWAAFRKKAAPRRVRSIIKVGERAVP